MVYKINIIKYFAVSCLLIVYSCVENKELSKSKLTSVQARLERSGKNKYSINVPKDFRLEKDFAGGESGGEDKYWYRDSSVIYVTNFDNSLNYTNIQGSGNGTKRFAYRTNDNAKDTLIFTGVSANNLCWKEILIGKVTFGYTNVSLSKKELFDKSLASFRLK